jgi:hypothetical protein
MTSILVDVPENAGLLATSGELFHPDPKLKAEIRFKIVTATEILPGYRDCSDNQKMIQIEHIVTDVQGRRFVFASVLSPYFFWNEMFLVDLVGCSSEYVEFSPLLDKHPHQRKVLVEKVYFESGRRTRRALYCHFPPSNAWSERIFPIYEKHMGAELNLIYIEWEETNKTMSLFIVEFNHLSPLEDTNGKEYGGYQNTNHVDKFCYRFSPHKMLWRHFKKPVIHKYGSPESFDGVSFEPVSPFIPITFRELKSNE